MESKSLAFEPGFGKPISKRRWNSEPNSVAFGQFEFASPEGMKSNLYEFQFDIDDNQYRLLHDHVLSNECEASGSEKLLFCTLYSSNTSSTF